MSRLVHQRERSKARARAGGEVGVQRRPGHVGQQRLAAGEAMQRHAHAPLGREAQELARQLDLDRLDLVLAADEQTRRLAGGAGDEL